LIVFFRHPDVPRRVYLGQLVVAEVQVDQRVELGEAGQLLQLVAGQIQSLDVAQTGVSGLQDPQAVVGQIHVDQIVQVLQNTAVTPVKVTSQAERSYEGHMKTPTWALGMVHTRADQWGSRTLNHIL